MKKSLIIKFALSLSAGALAACSAGTSFTTSEMASSVNNPASSPQFTTEIRKDGTLVFSDSPAIGRAQLTSGQGYTLTVKPLNSISASYSVKITNRDSGATVLNSAVSANQALPITFSTADDFQLVATATSTSGGAVSKTINIAVACSSSTFSVNSNNISVASSGTNKFTFSAAGVSPGGSDYQCAFDFNGDGILDQKYASCETNVQAVSNHVGARKVSVSVRNVSCNTQVMATKTVMLQEPIAGAGINFIRGDVAQPGDSANLRANLTHSSTNNGGLKLALCNYDDDAGLWSIRGLNDYSDQGSTALASSMDHGMSLVIAGVPRNGVTEGAISTANAKISNSQFITDKQSDGIPQMTFQTNSSCSLQNFQLTAQPVSGQPCADGQTLVEPGATVIGEGQFSCSNMSANESPSTPQVNINSGKFYCIYHIGDSCIGGGGGGGGGIPPIEF